ncbi:MAG: hypothetical protein H6621_10815 [Halobacteriovoraceae bacterium]|nr:hypothetical protein [Halobacteriovoraceae bacterium]MCB9095549.1 hypothetical protein [Halobacteriovoraceae bacterium]
MAKKLILILVLIYCFSSSFYVFAGEEGFGRSMGYPAILVHFKGRTFEERKNSKALVLACAHCHQMMRGFYVYNLDVLKRYDYVHLYDKDGNEVQLRVKRILYAANTHHDKILFELKLTYDELAKLHNIRISRPLAAKVAPIGTKIIFNTGLPIHKIQKCTIDLSGGYTYMNEINSVNILKNLYVYHDCVSEPGLSGAIIINEKTNEVLATNTGGPGIRIGETLDWSFIPFIGRYRFYKNLGYNRTLYKKYYNKPLSFGSDVSVFYNCLDNHYELDLEADDCNLYDEGKRLEY